MLLFNGQFCTHCQLNGVSDEVKDETPYRHSLVRVQTQMLESMFYKYSTCVLLIFMEQHNLNIRPVRYENQTQL